MRGYETWSFRDRSFAMGLGLSVAWHAFWFLSLSIAVGPEKRAFAPHPVIVSLGPVLDDSLLRTLVETKTQTSRVIYRRWTDFSKATELEMQTTERHVSSDVVSVPSQTRLTGPLRQTVGGQKSSPAFELLTRLNAGLWDRPYTLEGELKDRPLLSRPREPVLPPGFGPADLELEFAVDATGTVESVDVLQSSGDAGMDEVWTQYLYGWKFAQRPGGRAAHEKGRVRFELEPADRGA